MPQAHGTQAEIQQLEHAFWKALVERDVETSTRLLAPEALMVRAHGTMRFDPGQYAKMLADPKHGLLDYELRDMDVLSAGDDIAIATYRARQKMQVDGKVSEQEVVDSSTWVRMDGGWKCVAHTESEAGASPRPGGDASRMGRR